MISHCELVTLLAYNPSNGFFTWKQNRGRIRLGATAGALRKDGYLQITLHHKLYLAHRLAWFYITEEWPSEQIDHINKNKSDNRLCNLRLATNKQNGENLPLLSVNVSGHRGVSWDAARQKWKAQVKHFGQNIFLGRFDSIADAAKTARDARDRLFTHCTE